MIFSQFITGCVKKSFHKIQRTSFLPYTFQPRIKTQKSSLLLEGLKKEEKCYTKIFWATLLFFHLSHNAKDNFSPLFIFTLNSTKKKKGIFLRFKTLLQFYRGKFHCKSSKSLVSHINQEKEGFLLICRTLYLSFLISPNLSQGFYKAMRLLFPYNFVAVNSRMPLWSTEENVQSQYYRRMRNEKSVNCRKSHTFIILSQQISQSL